MTVAATTNRTIGRFAARTSTIVPPRIEITATSAITVASSTGTIVNTTFPGSVSRSHVRLMTVTSNRLADGRTWPGEGAGEHVSERTPRCVSERAQPATRA